MDDGINDPLHNSVERSRRRSGLNTNQWAVLVLLGGLLLAIGATLILVLRSGTVGPTPSFLTATDPALRSASLPYVGEIVSPSLDVYWPPKPQPLASPDAPGNRLWWDARYAYRRVVFLDVVARRAPAGMTAEVRWAGDEAVREGKARADGADVRVVFWDGRLWHELERTIWSSTKERGWRVSFALVGSDAGTGRYHLYYGYTEDRGTDPNASAGDERTEPMLLLALGPEEEVEWGPTVTWTANSTTTQTLVSPDGRMVFEHPAGGLSQDTRVRLRIVPSLERSGFGPLPDYEFHADPPPGGSGSLQVVRWDPPVTVSINLAGLRGNASSLTWAHFRYDTTAGTWNSVPIERDAETGVIRFTTDQP